MTATDELSTEPQRTPAGGGVFSPFRSLLTAQVIGAALGLVFWVLVARLVPTHEVGVAAAAISAQTLLGMVTVLGVGTLLISELPLHGPGRQRTLVLRSLGVVTVSSVLLGGALVLASPLLSPNLRDALGNPLGGATFVLGTAAAAWAIVVDETALGVRRSPVQVGRNLFASSLRFPVTALLLGIGLTDAHVLQLCWVLPLASSVPMALWRLRLRADRAETPGPEPVPSLRSDVGRYAGPALSNHVLSLSLAAASQMMPVVAAFTLTSVGNAEFAIAWLMASFAFLPPYLLAIALFAHGANVSTEEFRTSMEKTIPASLLLSATLCVGAWVLGEPVLKIFGGDYSTQSWKILALLVPAGLWMVFKDHLVALWRSQRRYGLATRLAVVALVLEIGGALGGAAIAGVNGLCIGWLYAMAVEMILAWPWLQEAFGGLRWQWPRPVLLRRGEAGSVSPQVLGAVALVLVVAGAGFVASRSGGGTPSSTPALTVPVACTPTAERPGPVVDLGVQAATGDDAHPLRTPAQVERLVDLADRAGAQVISTSVSWRFLQPRRGGPFSFTALDRVLDAARADGLAVRLQLAGMPGWAEDSRSDAEFQPPLTDGELARWGTFVRTVMQHVRGRVAYLEIWNEPNGTEYWPTGPDPAAFAALLDASYDVAKRVDPQVQVVTGGLVGNDIGYVEELYAALDEMDLARSPFDLVGVHPFSGAAAPLDVDPGLRYDREPDGAFDENFTGYREIHDVMADHGDPGLGIYVGQFGYSTDAQGSVPGVPDAVRAGYLTDALGAVTCTPYVVGFSWYYLHPTPWDPPSWTLVDAQLRPHQTYDALRDWTTSVARVEAGS